MSSRQFNQDASGAKRAAAGGPVYITDRGRPAHVLLTFEAYQELIGTHSILERLGEPEGVEDMEFVAPRLDEPGRPAEFE
ncbi:MAG: type II toxin-antitoxin system Phd/YefM family antitoxin [Actinomycetota bacterium]|nr:type II toxin-antitoxin system Phd/YefM family antitoxin [Actinomycetota bacterium]